MDALIYAVIIAAILINTVLKLGENAILSCTESGLSELPEYKKDSVEKIMKYLRISEKFSSSVCAITGFLSMLSGTLCALTLAPLLLACFKITSESSLYTAAFYGSAALAVLAVSFIISVLCCNIPSSVVFKSPEKIACALLNFVRFFLILFFPMCKLIELCTHPILKICGTDPSESKKVTEEEIKMMVDAGSETGMIDSEEQELIKNVFEFDDLTANDIATHRTGITILWTHETDEEWDSTITKSRHTYFPICEGSIDKVVGVLNSKDYFRLKTIERSAVMEGAVKSPYFVPESAKANLLFKNMKQRRNYAAIVIDEYGGMSGIVTVTDLLECIVGDIYEDEEEETQKAPEIEPLDSKMWKIYGSAAIEDVEEALDISIKTDCDTFSGYVIEMLGEIPDDGTVTTAENELMTVKITSIKDHRIEKTMVLLKEPCEEEAV